MDIHKSQIINADSRLIPLPDACAHIVVTSPPYHNCRNYGHADQVGREKTVNEYIDQMVAVFREVRRVLRDDGTVWLNIGTTCQAGQDMQIPHRLSIALCDDGWRVVADNVWHKSNTIPTGALHSPSRLHEHVFQLSKAPSHYYDNQAVLEIGHKGLPKRLSSVWPISSASKGQDGHPAIMPESLAEICILLGSSDGGCCPSCGAPYQRQTETGRALIVRKKDRDIRHPITDTVEWIPSCNCEAGDPRPCVVVDPFSGSGTVPCVAHRLGRVGIGIELNPDYCRSSENRLSATSTVTEPPVPPKGFCYAPDTCIPKPRARKQPFRYADVELWAEVIPLIKTPKPNVKGGRPRHADRKALDGILVHMIDGTPWRHLPADVCVGMTAWRRFRRWQADGTWSRIEPILRSRYSKLAESEAA